MKKILKLLAKDEFLRHFSIVTVGVGLASFLNLIYQLILVRSLSETQYGTLNALVALLTLFSALGQPLRTALTKFLSGYYARKEFNKAAFVLKHTFKTLTALSIYFLANFIFFSSYLAHFLKVENHFYLILIGIIISLTLIGPVFYSALWSMQLFKILTFIGIVTVLSKVVTGYSLMRLGFGVSGGLFGYLATPLFSLLIYLYLMPKYQKKLGIKISSLEPVKMAPIYKYFIPTTLALLSFRILTNMDVLLVKRFFSNLEAGYYSVAQIVGKVILFLPGAVYMVVFPKSAALHANNADGIHLLKKGLLIIALSCGMLTVICLAFPGLVLKILTSKTHPESAKLIGLFALVMSNYALVELVNLFHLSRQNTKFVIPICVLAVLQTFTVYYYHPSLEAVLATLLIFSVLTFFAAMFVLHYERK